MEGDGLTPHLPPLSTQKWIVTPVLMKTTLLKLAVTRPRKLLGGLNTNGVPDYFSHARIKAPPSMGLSAILFQMKGERVAVSMKGHRPPNGRQ